MKLKTFFILFALIAAPGLKAQNLPEVTTIESLDLERYQGLWFEIASIPQSFSANCESNTQAEYELLEDGKVSVLNSCLTQEGELSQAEGRARINPEFKQSSRLQVTFVNLFSWWWVAAGDYWVLDIDPDYQWSLVGHPERKSLWILSRTQTLSKADLLKMRELIEAQAYDSCRVTITQEGALKNTKLCELAN